MSQNCHHQAPDRNFFPHLIKIFKVHPGKKNPVAILLQTSLCASTLPALPRSGKQGPGGSKGNRGSQHPRGRQCSHPALGPGRSLRIQVGAPAKSLPVFQQKVIKTVEDIQFQLRQMSIPPGGEDVSLENSQAALVLQ